MNIKVNERPWVDVRAKEAVTLQMDSSGPRDIHTFPPSGPVLGLGFPRRPGI